MDITMQTDNSIVICSPDKVNYFKSAAFEANLTLFTFTCSVYERCFTHLCISMVNLGYYMSILKFGLSASTKKSEFDPKYNEKYPIVIVRPQGPK